MASRSSVLSSGAHAVSVRGKFSLQVGSRTGRNAGGRSGSGVRVRVSVCLFLCCYSCCCGCRSTVVIVVGE